MIKVNNTVGNLTKTLYQEYNGRSLESFPLFGLYFELVYTKENFTQFLNLLYKELSELNNHNYTPLSSVDEVKKFSKAKGFLESDYDDDEEFLEESLVELCSSRLRNKKRLVNSVVLPSKNDSPFDEYVLGKLKEFKLTEVEDTKNNNQKKRQMTRNEFEESQLEIVSRLTDELSKDYYLRWNSYLDRFYNLLDVFFKVKDFKDSKDFQVLMETLKAWRSNTKFKELNLYDLWSYRPDESNVTKISSKTNKSNRVSDLYKKTKLEFQ